MKAEEITEISGKLFGENSVDLYAILDGASIPGLPAKLSEQKTEHVCLYMGEIDPELAEVAPYLVYLGHHSKFANWVLGQGWGNHWGIFIMSQADLRTLHRHFRRFLKVHTYEGTPLYFRYYDPRVLRVYLPTCNEKEIQTVFGPVDRYLMEDEEPNAAWIFNPGKEKVMAERLLFSQSNRENTGA